MFKLNFDLLKLNSKRFQIKLIRKLSSIKESFINGTSAVYMEQMEEEWRKNPKSVHISWQRYFQNVYQGKDPAYQSPPPWTLGRKKIIQEIRPQASVKSEAVQVTHSDTQLSNIGRELRRAYRKRGHLVANVDPLGYRFFPTKSKMLERKEFPPRDVIGNLLDGLPPEIINREFPVFFGGSMHNWNFKQLISNLEKAYCGTLSLQIGHISNEEQENFIIRACEDPPREFTKEEKIEIFTLIQKAKQFEVFLGKKWPNVKRFGFEGSETGILIFENLIKYAAQSKYQHLNIGMAHRGRLSVLSLCCLGNYDKLFKFLRGASIAERNYSGDVHYHFGARRMRTFPDGTSIEVTLINNASHLESVYPILLGHSRAQNDIMRDDTGEKTLAVSAHGDAALSSLCPVFEGLSHTYPKGFTIKGMFHACINNKVGFTANPEQSRSSQYCTDVLFTVGAPILHVNSDDPEAVTRAIKILFDFRHKFKRDVALDLNSYRLYGHNEQDEPRFTQPSMYKVIKNKKPVNIIYGDKLVKDGIMTEAERTAIINKIEETLNEDFEKSAQEKHFKLNEFRDVDSPYIESSLTDEMLTPIRTGVEEETITKVLNSINEIPNEYKIHSGIKRIIQQRIDATSKKSLDWALCEAVAIGSLLLEGHDCRLTGEDCERGTFSHRHHNIHDQDDEMKVYNIFSKLSSDKARYSCFNSPISEFGTLAFEYGYSAYHNKSLVIWEAQFGDFVNGGQPILDEYISSGEMKWAKNSSMVLNLPHGLEGAGPEHSSASPERFLLMCNDDIPEDPQTLKDAINPERQLFEINWIVIAPSVPGTYFHALRRQVKLNVSKPLINMSPKLLLRHAESVSTFQDLMANQMERLIPDKTISNPEKVKKIIFSSGKVFFDLRKERTKRNLESQIVLNRIEQVAPFPYDLVQIELNKYPKALVTWVQEEPKNQGYWSYISPRFRFLLKDRDDNKLRYIGRPAMSASAPGVAPLYIQQVRKMLDDAMFVS